MTTVTSPWPGLGQPLFEMCWVYMAIAQIAQDPPPLSNGQTWKKSVPNHPGKPLHPRAYIGKKSTANHLGKPKTPPQ